MGKIINFEEEKEKHTIDYYTQRDDFYSFDDELDEDYEEEKES